MDKQPASQRIKTHLGWSSDILKSPDKSLNYLSAEAPDRTACTDAVAYVYVHT